MKQLISGPHVLNIQIKDLKKLWFSSDWHMNHLPIIKYTNRPFNTVEDMNNTIISNVNEKVKENDILINCGDVILGQNSMFNNYMDQIKCRTIYNCIGNHDIKNIIKKSELLPYREGEHVYWSYTILIMVYNGSKLLFSFTCSHCPMPRHNYIGICNIHGHLHTFEDISKYDGRDRPLALELLADGHYYDCGVDRHNFYPVSFIDIINHSSSIKIKEKILENIPTFFELI